MRGRGGGVGWQAAAGLTKASSLLPECSRRLGRAVRGLLGSLRKKALGATGARSADCRPAWPSAYDSAVFRWAGMDATTTWFFASSQK